MQIPSRSPIAPHEAHVQWCDVRKPNQETAVNRRHTLSGWEPTLTELAQRANVLWQRDGCPDGSDLSYWLRARKELFEEHKRSARQPMSQVRAVVRAAA
jgi:hypothetical protein